MLNEKMIMTGSEVEGIRQRTPEKDLWDCDVESLGLSQKNVQFRNKWRGELKRRPANPVSPGKWPLKRSVLIYIVYYAEAAQSKKKIHRKIYEHTCIHAKIGLKH